MKLFIIKTILMYLFFKNRKAGIAPGGLVWVHPKPLLRVVSTAFMMLFVLSSETAWGQKTIDWDTLTQSIRDNEPADFDDLYTVKLKGIDASSCETSITVQNVGLETEMPDVLKEVFIASSGKEFVVSEFPVLTSPPIQVKGDLLMCEVTTTPREESNGCENTNFSFEIPVKGGWKIDFSVGPAVSLGEAAQDDKFYLTTEDSTLQKLDNKNSVRPSIVAFTHFYPRMGRTSLGLLAGVGTGFKGVEDINLYVGGSAIFGRMRKFMVSAGCSFLRVDRLRSSQFQIGEKYNNSITDIGDVTEKVYEPSFFLSVSYALARRKNVGKPVTTTY